jgi:hypothetical protein
MAKRGPNVRRPYITAFVLLTIVLTPVLAAARPMSELGATYKWGMSSDDVFRMLGDQLHAKYSELVSHEPDVYKQDQLRQTERDLGQQLRESLVKFDGVSPSCKSWSTSLVQQEFAQRNDESMLVVAEPKLRRFLFFWHDKLYKQVLAFDSEHAVKQGSTFEDFTRLLQDRYGPAEMRFSPYRTRGDDMKLDHLEWPATGDYQLFASDQTAEYDNYYLVLFNPSVANQVEVRRKARAGGMRTGNGLVDSATAPATASSPDRNEDIVDRITNRK